MSFLHDKVFTISIATQSGYRQLYVAGLRCKKPETIYCLCPFASIIIFFFSLIPFLSRSLAFSRLLSHVTVKELESKQVTSTRSVDYVTDSVPSSALPFNQSAEFYQSLH
ncbi:hypothetical protein BIW11_03625 [Tropilaelaps mercedesae]|uniref:Uncharacterized protein n=1 Tax=Tropilaelaps mercedesae TaxID=418985 RepID=A0A1V9XI47_9ACAR|nr:hypothetical protein BIW11_03625 [Tropilaelaps mercedesae]